MKIKGSRLADGNKLFPPSITIEKNGLNVKIPGFFKGKTTFLAYQQISSVSVDSKLVGYSTIHFFADDSMISAHGFKKSEVKKIKAAIDKGKKEGAASTVNLERSGSSKGKKDRGIGGFFSYSAMQESIDRDDEKEDKKNAKIERKVEKIAEVAIGGSADEISGQLNKLLSIASSKPKKKIKNAIIEKIEFGVMKLRVAKADAEADYFDNKLEPLKKRGLFDFLDD